MNLVAIEAPALRVTLTRELPELFNTALGVVAASQRLQVVADQLVETFPEGLRLLPGASDKLLVDGERDVHSTQYTWTRIMCPYLSSGLP